MSRLMDNVINEVLDDIDGMDPIDNDNIKTIVIDVDEIHDSFGMPLVMMDILDAKKGVGSLSTIYNRLIHPTICEVVNRGISRAANNDELYEFVKDLRSLRKVKSLGNEIHDSLENKVWELLSTSSNRIEVRSQDLLILAISMTELLAPHIANILMDDIIREDHYVVGRVCQLSQYSMSKQVPRRNPDSLVVDLQLVWMNV